MLTDPEKTARLEEWPELAAARQVRQPVREWLERAAARQVRQPVGPPTLVLEPLEG